MEDTLEKLTKLPAPVTLILSFWFLGLAIRMTKSIPNKFIPLILCVGGMFVYPLISSDERVGFSYIGVKPMIYLQGLLYGAGAVAANEILRNIPIIGPFLEKIQNAFKRAGANGSMILTQEQVKKEMEKANEKSNINPTNKSNP